MTTTALELKKIAALACLETDEQSSLEFAHDLTAMMDLAEQLRPINTKGILPLLHPLDLNQTLRSDDIEHDDSLLPELKKLAPLFTDDLYWVPKVIHTGK